MPRRAAPNGCRRRRRQARVCRAAHWRAVPTSANCMLPRASSRQTGRRVRPRGVRITAWSTRMGRLGAMNTCAALPPILGPPVGSSSPRAPHETRLAARGPHRTLQWTGGRARRGGGGRRRRSSTVQGAAGGLLGGGDGLRVLTVGQVVEQLPLVARRVVPRSARRTGPAAP